MNEGLVDLVAGVMGLDEADVVGSLSREVDSCWDSMNHLRLITAMEEQYSIRLSMDEIQDIVTLDDVNSLLTQHLDGS